MNIQKLPLHSLKPNPDNPREDIQPGHPVYESLKKSIQNHDCVQPLVWNKRSRFIVGGNQRLKVLKDLGYEEIEVVVVDLAPEQEKSLNIALNKIQADWDEDKLAEILNGLSAIPNFDFSEIGFDRPEVSEILDNYLNGDQEDNFDFGEDLKAHQEVITQKGEIIQLGQHRLMCGDATSEDDLKFLLDGAKVDLFVTDWPYNVNYLGGSCPRVDTRPKKSRKWDRIYSDNMPQPEYETFMRKGLGNVKSHLKPGAVFYQWQAHRQLGPLYQILTELDFHVACLICWAKESAAISYADYSFQTEQAVYGWLKPGSHYFTGEAGASNLWMVKRDNTHTYSHPCQKPVELSTRQIKNSSKRGEVVLDIFMGSGSVLIGSEMLGRHCHGLELDPKYCDSIVRRYLNYVGRDKAPQDLRDRYMNGVTHGK